MGCFKPRKDGASGEGEVLCNFTSSFLLSWLGSMETSYAALGRNCGRDRSLDRSLAKRQEQQFCALQS